MKIKIKNVQPNPYRDMANYPINREKVETLKASFEQSGYWDNVVVRQQNGVFELLYGHHRMVALTEYFGEDFEANFIVKKLTNSQMVLGLIAENMDVFNSDNNTITESVKLAKNFLDGVIQGCETYEDFQGGNIASLISDASNFGQLKKRGVGRDTLEAYLKGSVKRWHLRSALQQINAVEAGEVDEDALKMINTPTAASSFVTAVKRDKMPAEKQKDLAKKITDEKISHKNIEQAVNREAFDVTYGTERKKPQKKESVINFNKFVSELVGKCSDLDSELNALYYEMTESEGQILINKASAVRLTHGLESLDSIINKLLKFKK